jgi:hypothetical protein
MVKMAALAATDVIMFQYCIGLVICRHGKTLYTLVCRWFGDRRKPQSYEA